MLCDGMVNQIKFCQFSKVYVLQRYINGHVDFGQRKLGWILKIKYHRMFSVNLNSNSKCPMLARGWVEVSKSIRKCWEFLYLIST